MQWTGNPSIHLALEIIGFVTGVSVYAVQRARRGDTLPVVARTSVITGAALGATLGARLLF